MTSISSTQYSHQSPRAMMDKRISAAVSAGTISATDQTALSGALDSIDSSLSASQSSGTKPTGGIKDRVDSLIADQVKAGTLTEDQASELKTIFAQGPGGTPGSSSADGSDSSDDMAMNGVGGVSGAKGHCGGHGGPPPASNDDDSSTTSTSSTADSASTQLDTLISFLQKLRGSMASSTYGTSSSSTASDSSNSGMLVNAMA